MDRRAVPDATDGVSAASEPRELSGAQGSSVMKMQRREVLGVLTAAAGSALLPGSFAAAAEQTPVPNNLPQEKVTGIGGFFFRARDPKALSQWYRDHVGITVVPQSYGDQPWTQQAGPTAFAPFPETSNYFGDPAKQWMMNFRVADL